MTLICQMCAIIYINDSNFLHMLPLKTGYWQNHMKTTVVDISALRAKMELHFIIHLFSSTGTTIGCQAPGTIVYGF